MNVLAWHVHAAWMTSFVSGDHDFLIPFLPDHPPQGKGRAEGWGWPERARQVDPVELADLPVDVVVVQSQEQELLAQDWLGGRIPGRDVPLVWVEHNTPGGPAAATRHPAADRDDVTIVHVTATNQLMWDCGTTRTVVIDHGSAVPRCSFVGDLSHAAIVANEPARRGRAVGTDLYPAIGAAAPTDLFGMGQDALAPIEGIEPCGNLPHDRLQCELARRRVYVHPYRWTSLGLALVEAMHIGMPIVALATTETPDAVPPGAGVVSNRVGVLAEAVRTYTHDREAAAAAGTVARRAARDSFGLDRFHDDWNRLLEEVTR